MEIYGLQLLPAQHLRHGFSAAAGGLGGFARASLLFGGQPDSGSDSCSRSQLPRASEPKSISSAARHNTTARRSGKFTLQNHVQLGCDTDADGDQRQWQRQLPARDAGASERKPAGFGSAIYGLDGRRLYLGQSGGGDNDGDDSVVERLDQGDLFRRHDLAARKRSAIIPDPVSAGEWSAASSRAATATRTADPIRRYIPFQASRLDGRR